MNKNYLYSIIAVFAIVVMACNTAQQTSKEEVEYKSYIEYLASPIKLKPDTTSFLITDYLADTIGLSSIELEGKKLVVNPNMEVIIPFNISTPISNLKVVYKNVVHDIPVFKSEKIKHTFTYKATSDKVKEVGLAGSVNGWNYKANPLKLENGMWSATFTLNPGEYQYRIWEDGKEKMDQNNSVTADNGLGGKNNVFTAGIVRQKPELIYTSSARKDTLEIYVPSSIKNVYSYFENTSIVSTRQGDLITIVIPKQSKNLDRSVIRVFADDGFNRTNDLFIPLTHGDVILNSANLDRSDLQNAVMYFMMIDRFVDGDSSNNRPTNDPSIMPQANNLGGDIQGITQKIKEGYFQKMGINTIWISPISRNAEGAWGLWNKGAKSTFSAYHGYWPTALTKVDDRLGSEEAFKELIAVAHENGLNVVLDYVAHHVHQEHLLYKQHPEWTTPLYLPDGTMNTEKWDEHRLTTWFDTFLPTWDFSKKEVVEALTDSAMYWVENYDLDGFRHDATKHIPEAFWQTLTSKVKAKSDKKIFQIGETYGSPELISSYIGSGQLDAQFDFNLYDAMVDAFAKPESGFENLSKVINQSLSYYGSHHLMGNITGNQDRARFISYADGSIAFSEDAKLAGWTRKIENKGADGFMRMAQLQAFILTTPGIPCIYYGDEIGMPGGNDPDNRRMMKFSGLDSNQVSLKSQTTQLANLRKTNIALSYGEFIELYTSANVYIYARNYFGKTAIMVFVKGSSSEMPLEIQVPRGINLEGLKNSNGGSDFQIVGNKLVIPSVQTLVGSKGYAVLVN